MIHVEYIEHMDSYRVYDDSKPSSTIAYINDYQELKDHNISSFILDDSIREKPLRLNSNEKMKIVVVEPRKQPYIKEISREVKDIQAVVEGHFEVVPLTLGQHNLLIVCNENGKYNGSEPNRTYYDDIIYGTFFVCAFGEYDFEGLSEEQVQAALERYTL